MGFFDKLKESLAKTRKGLIGKIEDVLEDLEEVLIISDVGARATEEIINALKEQVKKGETKDFDSVRELLKREMVTMLDNASPLVTQGSKPIVILTVGVNGVGKTTTIGKLASRFRTQGKSVLLAAADTFRAAGIEQLEIWAQRADSQIVKHQKGSDPAAVAFDAVEAAMQHRSAA